MNTPAAAHSITLEPNDTRRLARLCGQFDENLRQIEQRLNIEIRNRGNAFAFYGDLEKARTASNLLCQLYRETRDGDHLYPERVHLFLQQADMELRATGLETGYHLTDVDKAKSTVASRHAQLSEPRLPPADNNLLEREQNPMDNSSSPAVLSSEDANTNGDNVTNFSVIRTKKGNVRPRGLNQQNYVRAIQTHDINFGIGPAGTGKTYLAVACAVESYLRNEVERILLVRPAVEAGEKLGFLPGDLSQKVDPYLRPLYDALYEMMGVETVGKLIERQAIEVAPLAYMRGRTLNNAYIILDESQNTTQEQMKMFLTRVGFGSTAVITGDLTQIDLPRGTRSGLLHSSEVLKNVEGISFTHFLAKDVVRHPLVQRIVEAYDEHEQQTGSAKPPTHESH